MQLKASKEIWCCPCCPATWDPGWEFERRNESYYQLIFHLGLEHSLAESIMGLRMLGAAYDTIVRQRSKIKEKRKIKEKAVSDYSNLGLD